MAKLEANLTIKATTGTSYDCIMEDVFTEIYRESNVLDNTDAFTEIAALGKTNSSALKGTKLMLLKNNGVIPIELQFKFNEFKDDSNVDKTNSVDLGAGATANRYVSYFLGANEYIVLPNQFFVGYNANTSAGNAATIDNKAGFDINSGNLYRGASDATGNILLNDGDNINTTDTAIVVDDGDFFRAGDLIRLENEIMEVTSISGNTLTCKRGVLGSTAATHNDDVAIRFPFFNAYTNFDKYSYTQTDTSGKCKIHNLFGYGRSRANAVTHANTGIVKGSFAMKFYNSGYQEFGMSGVTPNTESGLAASTAYGINITVDGGSTFVDLIFTTDATNTKFGGNNGVLGKIQSALDTQFHTAGHLFEKGVTVSIVNGDIRFTSTNRTRASAILLATPGSATTPFGVGRIPAIGDIETPISALLPDDTLLDNVNYNESKNKSAFAYDDGKGNILGAATGTINYETGALDFTGPIEAEFATSFNYNSAYSGGIGGAAVTQGITKIYARSMNSKINAEVELLSFV
jgi:hypothetical protein